MKLKSNLSAAGRDERRAATPRVQLLHEPPSERKSFRSEINCNPEIQRGQNPCKVPQRSRRKKQEPHATSLANCAALHELHAATTCCRTFYPKKYILKTLSKQTRLATGIPPCSQAAATASRQTPQRLFSLVN